MATAPGEVPVGSVLIILILILTREVEGSAKIVRGVAKERVHIRSYTLALRTQEGHTILHTKGLGGTSLK